jgi:hypothetical protein
VGRFFALMYNKGLRTVAQISTVEDVTFAAYQIQEHLRGTLSSPCMPAFDSQWKATEGNREALT